MDVSWMRLLPGVRPKFEAMLARVDVLHNEIWQTKLKLHALQGEERELENDLHRIVSGAWSDFEVKHAKDVAGASKRRK